MMTRLQLIERLCVLGLERERALQLIAEIDDMLTFEPELAQLSAEVKPASKTTMM